MECILTCCINSSCSWCRGKVAPCYESVIYEAVAAATSESTSVEPGKLDVGATEGHELQHIGNQKMPTASSMDNLSLVCLPPSEDDDWGDDDDGDDDVQIRAWKGNDLTLESISDEETHPGLGRGPEDMRLMHRSKRRFSPSLMHTKVREVSESLGRSIVGKVYLYFLETHGQLPSAQDFWRRLALPLA
uniref:aspartate-rich protein 1-like isoform X4 n=1 Tax=Macaca mulatta TaxID=9544 RepID=UPI0010A257F3|nr:aspartate-rich protein 1-like isoform X4 [Macaca mulatta]